MTNQEILNKIWEYLEEEIKTNKSLEEIKKFFLNLINEEKLEFQIQVKEEIYNKIPEFRNIPQISTSTFRTGIIFEFALYRKNDMCFTLSKIGEDYTVFLSVSKDILEDKQETTIIDVSISKNSSTWKTTKYVTDEDNYYYDYSSDMFCYNKNLEGLVIEDKEEIKDSEFSQYFNIPIEEARKCRLNFSKFRDYLNERKMLGQMARFDEIYFRDKKYFTAPFSIEDFTSIILENAFCEDYIDDIIDENIDADEYPYEEYLVEENIDEETLAKINRVYIPLSELTLLDGEFVMTYNMLYNLSSYVSGKSSNIETCGLIIRKLDSKYTSYYVYINKEVLIIYSKNCTKSEVQEFFSSNEYNYSMEGLNEFFGYGKSYGLN